MNPETTAVVAALAGAVVGAGIGFLGTLVRDKLAEADERRKLAAALLVELNGNKLRFQEYGEDLKKLEPSTPLVEIPDRWSGHNFFPVFDGSTYRLGLFKSEDAAIIVRATMQFKILAEHINSIHDRELLHAHLDVPEHRREDLRKKDAKDLVSSFQKIFEDADRAINILNRYARMGGNVDRFWKVFAIVLVLIILVGVALATRYQYYTLQNVVFLRRDRWTGQMQKWQCTGGASEAVPEGKYLSPYRPSEPSNPIICGWREYQP